MITIDIKYTPNIYVSDKDIVVRHFTTMVPEVKDVQNALLECLNFLTKQGNTYLDHYIILGKEEP